MQIQCLLLAAKRDTRYAIRDVRYKRRDTQMKSKLKWSSQDKTRRDEAKASELTN